ncbi:MAG: hypothetical protein AB7V26_02990 [Lysobacterales bacterium]
MTRNPGHRREFALREQLADLAARIMVEQGVLDFALAKRKAADRLHLGDDPALPSNSEVDQALRRYQALFRHEQQPLQLRKLRAAAVQAMQLLERFEPRLVGAVLDGSADQHSAVCLHLFSDDPVAVEIFLGEQGIPFTSGSRLLRLDAARELEAVRIRFSADGSEFDLSVLPRDSLRQAPLDRVHGRSMRRATRDAVRALLEDR